MITTDTVKDSLIPPPGPVRLFALNSLLSSFGVGAYLTISVIYFVKIVGLAPHQVATGLSAAALLGLTTSVWVGRLADRRGPRQVVVVISALQAVLIASYALVGSFVSFLVVVCALAVLEAGGMAARNALVAGVLDPALRVTAKAFQRTAFNVGAALGTMAAAIPLATDSPAMYRAFLLINAVTAASTILITLRLPVVPALGGKQASLRAVGEGRYMATAVYCGLVSMHHSILVVAIPLYVSLYSKAPAWLVSVLFILNTVLVIALQVRSSGGVAGTEAAFRATRWGSWLVAAACLVLAMAHDVSSTWVLVSAMVVAVIVLTLGEIRTSAAAWSLGFGLAPEEAQGEYQAAFGIGMAAERLVGPFLATSVVAAWGSLGWFAAAGVFAALPLFAGLLHQLVAPLDERTSDAVKGMA